jgi:hypothetical protein
MEILNFKQNIDSILRIIYHIESDSIRKMVSKRFKKN